jgi:hypothetical protein
MNSRFIAHVVGLLLCGTSASLPTPTQASEPSVKTLTCDDLLKSLEAREKAVQMVELRWTVDHHYEPGSQTSAETAQELQMRGKSLKTGIPAEPATFHYSSELRLKGNTMEYLSKTFHVDDRQATMSLIPYRTSYDGRVSKFLVGSDPTRERTEREPRTVSAGTPPLMPIWIYYRPLDETIFAILKKKSLKLTDQALLVDGHRCVRFNDGSLRVCLDRDRTLIPIAFQRFDPSGNRYLDATIEYAPHGSLSFVPKSFVLKRYSRTGKLAETITGDIFETHWGRPAR